MVKLIILDIDGVLVGNKQGFNFPYPNKKVISALQKIHKKGIPIILCSARFHSAVTPLVKKIGLRNPHITDSGALITDLATGKIIRCFTMEKNVVSEIIAICLKNNIYIECCTEKDYFIQKDQINSRITGQRTLFLQKSPIVVNSLLEDINNNIIKLLPIAKDEADKQRVDVLLKLTDDKVKTVWSKNYFTLPLQYRIITAKSASKVNAVSETTKSLKIQLKDTLAVGDTMGDWEFIEPCGYVATMENAPAKLKEKVKTKGKGKYLIAPSVDDNGLLHILDYFLKGKI
ncbi:HAD-IIB family hydrolase [Candidatus Daviesbacteria bacterium]|nr:HAD-IIB family hydrolase [Candidatus Daviesbacteria bacterium]